MARKSINTKAISEVLEDVIFDEAETNNEGVGGIETANENTEGFGGIEAAENSEVVMDFDLSDILGDMNNESAAVLAIVEEEAAAEIATETVAEEHEVLAAITAEVEENELAVAEALLNATDETVEAVAVVEKTVKEKVARVPRGTDRAEFFAAAHIQPEEYTSIIDNAAKKVKEKIENLADAFSGRRLSGYTKAALKHANTNGGEFTVKGLVETYETEYKFSPGTARAQAQQMSALFSAVGLADKDGKTFRLRDNELTRKLSALAA